MTQPVAVVTIGGQIMGAAFFDRLVSLECTDNEGVRSDTFRAVLNDGPEAGYLAIPERGELVTVALGQIAPTFIGAYLIDEVTVRCRPYALEFSGKSADVRKDMKRIKVRHWDGKTVSSIVSEIAGEHGLSPRISGDVGSHHYEWIGQEDESDLHFVERLARRHNAVFAVKNGQLIFAEKGSGLSASGLSLSSGEITPANLLRGSCVVRLADRSQYKDVIAYYQDKDQVKRKEVRVQADPQGVATDRLGEPYASEAEATRAAGSRAKQLQRAADRLSARVDGDPAFAAGAPVTVSGIRPGIDGRPWIIKSVRHRYDKGGGFTTQIEAEAQA